MSKNGKRSPHLGNHDSDPKDRELSRAEADRVQRGVEDLTEVAVLPKLFLTVDLGYHVGFQSGADGDLKTRYLHIGAGFAVRL